MACGRLIKKHPAGAFRQVRQGASITLLYRSDAAESQDGFCRPFLTDEGLLHKHKLLRVNQRPQDILVSPLFVLEVTIDVVQRETQVLGVGTACEGPQEQLLDFFGIGPGVTGQEIGAAARAR
jgi:hypothetical protein